MTLRKIAGITGWVAFAIISVAIQYEVKVALHRESGTTDKTDTIHTDGPAPDFSLEDLSGQQTALASYRGKKVVLLDFWATWCGPCRMSMPDLQKLKDKFKDRPFELLSLNQGETQDEAQRFIKRKNYTFHVLLDKDRVVAEKYGVTGIPTLVLIDKKGVVRRISIGYSENEGDLKDAVEKLARE